MKTLLSILALACGTLLAATSSQAAPVSQLGNFAKKFGNFKAGDQFSLKVKKVTIVSTTGKIPKGIPNFKKGAKINFKIGSKGELKGPGFSAAFLSATGNDHAFHTGKDPFKLITDSRMIKAAGKKPTTGNLSFHLVVLDGFNSNAYQVDYTF